MDLLERLKARKASVVVVGLGYAGLPVALQAASSGFDVTGIDLDRERVETLAAGISPFLDISSDQIAGLIREGRFHPTADTEASGNADVILICVPTPLRNDTPDMTAIESAAKEIARNLQPGTLVILESTTYPGTTEEFLKQILESSGLRAGSDFSLGFSPERIDPGNAKYGIANVPKVVGGIDDRSTDSMEAFYGAFIERVVRVSSPRTAEMAKLLENTYRHVNIALVNEIAILCHDLGIDVWEAIEAAATKPFGFQAFYPGPGWGGHCIPVDPAYLSWRVRQMGETARFVELAREINNRMPAYVLQRIADCLNEQGKSLKSSSVLILGVAYKPDVADYRESPALEIIARLLKSDANVNYHDPHISEIAVNDKTLSSIELTDNALSKADIVLIVTNHSSYDWKRIAGQSQLVLDTRNALKGLGGKVIKL